MCHRTRDEHSLAAISEARPKDELAHVVETAGTAIAIAGVAHKGQVIDCSEHSWRDLQLSPRAHEKFDGAVVVGRPYAKVVVRRYSAASEDRAKRNLACAI